VSIVSRVLGLSIAAFGVLAIALPESFDAMLRQVQTPAGLYLGAGGRVLLGISLLLSAARSRAPETLRVLALVFIVAGLVMPFVGLGFFRSAIDSFLSLGLWAARAWGVIALGLGLFIAYAVGPRARTV
jgi:hypothetical protein